VSIRNARLNSFERLQLEHETNTSRLRCSFAFWNASAFFGTGIPNWDVSSMIDATEMFLNATRFEQNLCAWGNLNSPMLITTDMFQGTACPITSSPNLSNDPSGPWCEFCGESRAPTPNPLTGTGGAGNFLPTTASPTETFRPTAQPSTLDKIDLRSDASRIWNLFGDGAVSLVSILMALCVAI